MLDLLPPSWPQIISLSGFVLTLALLLGLAGAFRMATTGIVGAVLFGWQVLALALTLAGLTGQRLSLLFWPLVVIACGGVVILLSRERAHLAGTLPFAVLTLPFLLIVAAKQPSEVDTFTHWLPNAEYLTRHDRLPSADLPSASAYPGFPYNLTFISYASSRLVGHFVENAAIVFNGGLLIGYAIVIADLLRHPTSSHGAAPPAGWRLAGVSLLFATALNPTFVPKIALTAFPDAATSVVLAVAGILAWRLVETGAPDKETRKLGILFASTLALLVNLKQANLGLCLSLLMSACVVARSASPTRFRHLLPWFLAAFVSSVAMYVLWRLFLASGSSLKENKLLPFSQWQFSILPTVLGSMAITLLRKAGYAATIVALVVVVICSWRRARRPFDRLAMLVVGTFAAYNAFLALVYIGHFEGNASTSVQSFWRYSTHVGYFAWAAAVYGAANALRPWADRHLHLWRRYGWAAPALVVVMPILGIGAIRFDLQHPKPLLRTLMNDPIAIPTDRAALVAFIPGENGSIAALIDYYLQRSRPNTRVAVVRDTEEFISVVAEYEQQALATYVWLLCSTPGLRQIVPGIPPGQAALLKKDRDEWAPVHSWQHSPAPYVGLAKTIEWKACEQ